MYLSQAGTKEGDKTFSSAASAAEEEDIGEEVSSLLFSSLFFFILPTPFAFGRNQDPFLDYNLIIGIGLC